MTTTTDDRAILIIGAGPVGLTMACELARHGAPCRIIDKEAAPSATSKALAIFPRTLEVFETMGIAERILSAGLRLRGIAIHNQREAIARIDLASVQSPYPFVVSLPQSETERILSERVASFGVTVEREWELTGLTQTDTSVCAVIRDANGREEKVETPWLLGCDGAHSETRHLLGLEFKGEPYDESFVLADVKVDTVLSRDEAHLFFSEEGIFAIIAFGSERSRVIANIPAASRDQNLADLTLEEIQALADRRGPAGMHVSDPVWMSRFHISHRKVAEFRKLRVFLAGDAAHIHSPAGGQGMNTGIQDAFNLAWKIALVVSGRAAAPLLASYNIEREPVARGVLNLTDRITRMATVRNPVIQTVRNILLPVVSGVDFFEGKIADRLAELAVNYRHSPIVENHGSGRPRAGDRAPDGELRDENGRARRLFELFREPRHALLLFLGSFPNGGKELETFRNESIDSLGNAIHLHRIVRGHRFSIPGDLFDISGLVHSLYEMMSGGMILVRPDGYIAFRSNGFDPDLLRKYFERIFPGTGSILEAR
jgi:2-polyprenyl-6-methoxyphenol hydroxylase-like FAD-dependent oxidoreductase